MKRLLLLFSLLIIGLVQVFAEDDFTCSVLPMGDVGRWEAKYFHPTEEQQPDENWFAADFDDSDWGTLQGPISTEGYGPIPGYAKDGYFVWSSNGYDSYCFRRYFDLESINENVSYALKIINDDQVHVFVNGKHAVYVGYAHEDIQLFEIPTSYLHVGKNTIAIEVINTNGAGLLDFGIHEVAKGTFKEAKIVTVEVSTAGTLWDTMNNMGLSDSQIRDIEKLRISGEFDKQDIDFIRRLMPNLRYLDISGTNLKEIPDDMGFGTLYECILPTSLERIGSYAYANQCWKLRFGHDDDEYPGVIKVPTKLRIGYESFSGSLLQSKFDLSECSSLILEDYALDNSKFTEFTVSEKTQLGYQSLPSTMRTINVVAQSVVPVNGGAFNKINHAICVVNIPVGMKKQFALTEGWSNVFDIMQEYGYQVKFDTSKGSVSYMGKTLENDEIIFHNEAAATFNVEPAYGYQISNVTLDGEAIDFTDNSISLPEGVKGGTIRINFAPKHFNLTVNVTGNGKIFYNEQEVTNSSIIPVEYSAQATFALQPDEGFAVKSIMYNEDESVIQNGGLTYVTPVCAGDATLDVEFVSTSELQNTVSFTVKSDDNGIITYKGVALQAPETVIRLDKGGYATFVIRAKNGCYLDDVKYNGESMMSELQNDELNLTNINTDAILEVICNSASELEINNPNGNLAQIIANKGINIKTISSLKVTGNVAEEDFTAIKEMLALQNIDLSESSVEEIPNNAFADKNPLQSIAFPSTLNIIGEHAFDNCRNLTTVTGVDNITIIKDAAFQNCGSLMSLPFGDNIQEVRPCAFYNALSKELVFDKLVFPACLKHIGNQAFKHDKGDESARIFSVDLSSCIFYDSFGYQPFCGRGTKSMKLPRSGNYSLDYYPFDGMDINELVIPKAVKSIWNYEDPFPACIERLYLQSETPLPCDAPFNDAHNEKCTLFVPVGTAIDYQYSAYWSSFQNIVEYGYQVISNDFGHVKINGEDYYNGDNYFPTTTEPIVLTFIADTKYHVATVTLNDEVVTLNADESFVIPAGQKVGIINVKFAPDVFNIEIAKTGNGKVLYKEFDYADGSKIPVDYNSFATLTLVPDNGYVVKSVAFNDMESVVQNGGNTFVTPIIKDNAKFAVEFAESSAITDVVNFNVTTGENGTVEYKNTTLLPTTSVFVKTSEPAIFKMIPAKYYIVKNVVFNGEDVTEELESNLLTIAIEDLKESTLDVTFTYDTRVAVDVAVPGTLNSLISNASKMAAKHLIVTGTLNDDDFSTIKNAMPNVEVLDLSRITNTSLPWCAFSKNWDNWGSEIGLTSLREVKLPVGLYDIGDGAFAGCTNLETVNFAELTKLANIGHRAFSSTALKSVNLSNTKITDLTNNQFRNARSIETFIFPVGLTRIGEQFEGSKLTSVDLSACTKLQSIDQTFRSCALLTEVKLPEGLTTIGGWSFYYCTSLSDITLPTTITSINCNAFERTAIQNLDLSALVKLNNIDNDAFRGCKLMEDITLPANIKSIGYWAFAENYTNVHMMGTVPPTLNNINNWNIFEEATLIFVPGESVGTYRQTPSWEHCANQVVSKDTQTEFVINTEAHALTSSVRTEILKQLGYEDIKTGSEIDDATDNDADADYALTNVTSLKISGTINSYDIMVMRNKMVALRNLDLSEASIVANNYEYYQGYHTEDDVLGPYAFTDLKLRNVNLPASIKEIGDRAFNQNRALHTIVFHEGLEVIGDRSFSGCSNIKTLSIPASVSLIKDGAFEGNNNIEQLTFADNSALREINSYSFNDCYSMQELNLPYQIKRIGYRAFGNCQALTEIHIPTMVETIEDEAFADCRNVKKVFAATIEPISISQRAFSCWTTATLYIPDFNTSYYKYYWDTQWSQFIYSKERYHQDYEEFYINQDYTLEEDDERITGPEGTNPSAEFNEGSGFIVEGGDQNMDEITVESDGESSASIIVEGGLTAETLNVKINIEGNRWYFFCFPFNLKNKTDVSCDNDAQYVFRHYDGASRASNGNSGWKEVTQEEGSYLKAGKGYIFQSDRNCVMSITIKNPLFASETQNQELETYASENAQNASWNFIGNPYLSYFDMSELEKTGFTSPVTIWNGSGYEAISPVDDDYHFYPFQAFFVQKPDSMKDLVFNKDGQETKTQSETAGRNQAKKRMAATQSDRKLINLTITDGNTTDKTRVVFNDNKDMNYEIDCDAAKFFSSENIPQLYSVDNKNVMYSINERPLANGEVSLGFIANVNGEFTIAQTRMDIHMVLYDVERGITHDLSIGDYTFEAEQGTYNNRFILKTADTVSGIRSIMTDKDMSPESIYDLNGRKLNVINHGVNIINGKKVVVK